MQAQLLQYIRSLFVFQGVIVLYACQLSIVKAGLELIRVEGPRDFQKGISILLLFEFV